MNSLHGIQPVGPRQWKGARVIRVDALPAMLPRGLQSELLVRCQRENTSVELCLSTAGGVPGEVTALVILRALSGYPYEALDRLDRLSGTLLRRLADADIRCHLVEEGAADMTWPNRFFIGDLAPISAGVGFFPPEGEPNPAQVYVPGQYAARGSEPVDLGRLTTLLSGHPNALISLQLNVTGLFPNERKAVQENLAWFAAQPRSPIVQAGQEAFSRLNRLANAPLFMVAFTCIGSEACVRDISSQLHLCGLRSYRLPRLSVQGGGYALRGNEWLTGACVAGGHEPHAPRRMLTRMGRLTHLAPLDDVAAAFMLPQRTTEIKGVRINRVPGSREPLPPALLDRGGVYLGRHFETDTPVFIQPRDLTRHGFFVGKPGSGKTTFALGLLYRLYHHADRIPFLAFEPAKTEYRSLMECIPDLRVYTPGREDVAPIQLNPFLPPKGVRLEQYQQNLEAIFAMAISVDHPLDVIFPQVISRCYARYGWRSNSTRDSEGVRVFGIHEFIREFRAYIHEHYEGDPESLHNLENGGVVRLMALMQSPMFDTNASLDVEALLDKPTVIELDALNNASHKALVMGIVLTHLMLAVQGRGHADGKLRSLILVDEAHLLLSQNESAQGARPAQAVVEMLQNMTLILRAYGTALLFGDQSPARLTSVILDNVDLKMMFRLDSRQDRSLLMESALLSQGMADAMATLPAGEAYLHCSALNAPIHIAVPDNDKALKLNRAIPDEQVRRQMQVSLRPPFSQCALCGGCDGRCDANIRADGRFLANRLMDRPEVVRCLKDPDRQGELSGFLGEPLVRAVGELLAEFRMPAGEPRLTGCARAQFIRALLISPQFCLTEEALLNPGSGAAGAAPRGVAARTQALTDFQAQITADNILEMCAASDSEGAPGEGEGVDGADKA